MKGIIKVERERCPCTCNKGI